MVCFKYGFSKFGFGFNREQVLTWLVFKYGFSKFGLGFNREQVLTWSVLNTALASLGWVLIENRFQHGLF
jgi:hypothetical protein